MSKLEELIQELCPDGVEYKEIKKLALYRRGSFPQPYTNEAFYGGQGSMPFVQVADIEDKGFRLKNKTKQTISKIAQPKSIFVPKGTVICSIQGTIGRVAITQYNSYVDRTIAIFEKINDEIDKKFFAYCIELKFGVEKKIARGSTLKTITKDEFEKFSIPVPPLEVQCEIVRILDKFTLLTAELTAELTARRKQYEYYEKVLLHNKYSMIKLGEVCNIMSGGTPSKIKKEYWNNGTIKWLGSSVCKNRKFVDEVTGYITELGLQKSSAKLMKEGTTLIAMVGATIGKVSFLNFEATTNQNVACLFPRNKDILRPDYLYYACKNVSYKFRDLANGKFTMASLGFIKELEIPLPNIGEQQKIINILDRFDKLCNDITSGLPAEIELNNKRYEYYRDKLLTFKEKK